MKSLLWVTSLAGVLGFGSTVAMAGPVGPSAVSGTMQPFVVTCNPNDSTIIPGGFVVTKWCNGRLVGGLASTLVEADTNAESFGELGDATGDYCSLHFSDVQGFPGGYLAGFWCGGRLVSGVASDATDTGENGLGFAIFAATRGRYCSLHLSNIQAVAGGYQVQYFCNGIAITGIGSTATAAGQDALAKAEARWPASI